MNTGVVKSELFENLLNCLSLQLEASVIEQCQRKFGVQFHGEPYVRYEAIIRLLQYNREAESWQIDLDDDIS